MLKFAVVTVRPKRYLYSTRLTPLVLLNRC